MKELIKATLKLMAIFFLINFINNFFPSIILTLSHIISSANTIQPNEFISLLFYFLFNLTGIVLLWKFSDKISNYIIDNEVKLKKDLILTEEKIFLIAFPIIGVILLVTNLPELISQLIEFLFTSNLYGTQELSTVILPALKTGIALWLILNSENLVKLINKD
ncbi:hypothetical protein MWH25_08075 [Natroniella acetigena]|uniref:hypothetical protein n=1 Tax=Natroniella acetigena TaxID=52004 RepID=UPI00200A2DC5|nr:hypothetical protein [Natroniella acetigena]MCK8827699.1 hypothetical protein [Natroniella acetigena]